MTTSSVFKHAKRLAQRKIAGELFVVDPANRCLHQPRGAGENIWEWLALGASEEVLVEKLLSEYEVTPERARADVRRYVRELRRKKLIEEVSHAQ